MAYFYYDSGFYAPLIYAIFFFVYPLITFIFGEKSIPVLYVIFSIGAIQDITFINCTIFFVFMLLSWYFPKWKHPLIIIYIIEIIIVCVRHDKTPVHVLFHIAYCITLYSGANVIKKAIQKRAVVNVSEHFQKLNITPEEEQVISQRAEGKLMKEIDCFSKNTKTAYIQSAMKRNGCKTPEELIAIYSLQKRIN